MTMTIQLVRLLVAGILAVVGPVPLRYRACVAAKQEEVAQQALSVALATDVPPILILVVGWLESHWGCDPASGGSWGSPIDRNHRHTAGGPIRTGEDLRTSHNVCLDWEGAVNRYRCGVCHCNPARLRGYTPSFAMRLVNRAMIEADLIRLEAEAHGSH